MLVLSCQNSASTRPTKGAGLHVSEELVTLPGITVQGRLLMVTMLFPGCVLLKGAEELLVYTVRGLPPWREPVRGEGVECRATFACCACRDCFASTPMGAGEWHGRVVRAEAVWVGMF